MARSTQRIVRWLAGAALVAAPLAALAGTPPASTTAQCPPGETGVIYGCSPFCVAGKFLDTQTGLCMPIAPPPPPPPAPRV
ncbi:hypothetical protein ACQI4F_21295 [Mycolicibacterium vaccae]|uniref:hypothetical protein n=1 Tax=Mycolicibacterium vaccae TaxID=1810 RepID=UPI003CF82FDC